MVMSWLVVAPKLCIKMSNLSRKIIKIVEMRFLCV